MRWWHATPDVNGFNVLCYICWFSFLLRCYDHLCVVTRCEYIHIWEENRKKGKQTDRGEKKQKKRTFFFFCYNEDAAAEEDWNPTLVKTVPICRQRVIIRPPYGPMVSQVRGQGLIRYSGNFLAFPPMAGENTESPALRLFFFSSSPSFVVRTSTVKIKGEEKNNPTALYSESAIPPKIRDLFLYGFAVRIELLSSFFLFFFLKKTKKKMRNWYFLKDF